MCCHANVYMLFRVEFPIEQCRHAGIEGRECACVHVCVCVCIYMYARAYRRIYVHTGDTAEGCLGLGFAGFL